MTNSEKSYASLFYEDLAALGRRLEVGFWSFMTAMLAFTAATVHTGEYMMYGLAPSTYQMICLASLPLCVYYLWKATGGSA